jgi:hypothetical protein
MYLSVPQHPLSIARKKSQKEEKKPRRPLDRYNTPSSAKTRQNMVYNRDIITMLISKQNR